MSLRMSGKILKLLKTSMLSTSQKQSSKTPVNYRQGHKHSYFKRGRETDVDINPTQQSRVKKF